MNRNIFSVLAIIMLSLAIGCGICIEICCLQEPCVLCFLQRSAMLLIAVGLYWNLVYGVNIKHYGFSLLSALLGLACSLRHMALNVCKPVEATTFLFFSYRIYTWSFIIFFSSLICLSFLIFFYKTTSPSSIKTQNRMGLVLMIISTLCLVSVLYHKGYAF